ncbi:hypothetical protein PVAP13_7NG003378 [Panicum virgatum]|uniref:Uncharacterized protein n=1 Tax=Panicum virgatum TaxID=38727 RepID=A0A8T0Q418_PANVG|nr:hypothetical protein PVAP13_7NG003378 [Panicum virgatum]
MKCELLGRDLDRISGGLNGKIPIHIQEGLKCPEGQFDNDTTSEPVMAACRDMLKSIPRQARYWLKQKYFNDVPANAVLTKSPATNVTGAQWKALVNMWCTPEYRRQKHAQEEELTPLDYFKSFHCSKNGFTAPVQAAIARMEQIVAEPQGDQPAKTAAEAVAEVVQSRTFREVAGICLPSKKRTVATALQVQEIRAGLDNEKQGGGGGGGAQLLQKIVEQEAEMSELRLKAEEQETTLKSQTEELEALKKSTNGMHTLIQSLINFRQFYPPLN